MQKYCNSLFVYYIFQTNTSALSEMIDPSDRKVSEFSMVSTNSNRPKSQNVTTMLIVG